MGKASKRPKLSTGYTGSRKGGRAPVSLDASCRVGDGEEFPVGVLDLDRHGCRLSNFTAAVTKADTVFLSIGKIGPVTAHVRWAKRGSAGLKFDVALDNGELAAAEETATPESVSAVLELRRAISDAEI